MALRVMSADSHLDFIYLPPDTFMSHMDRKWGDAVPYAVDGPGVTVRALLARGDRGAALMKSALEQRSHAAPFSGHPRTPAASRPPLR